jgi:hypothetical protein
MEVADITSRRYPQTIRARVPAGLPQAIEIAARAQFTNPAEYLRRAVVRALQADGVHLDADGRIATQTPDTHAEKELSA